MAGGTITVVLPKNLVVAVVSLNAVTVVLPKNDVVVVLP